MPGRATYARRMPSLTREEAVARAELLSVHSYDVELDLSGAVAGDPFGSTVTVRFGCRQPGARTFVELKSGELLAATLNGVPLDPATRRENRLELTGLTAENELVVRARMPYSKTGEGLHRFVDPEDGEVYLYAQSFLDE